MATTSILPPIASGFVRKLYSILNGNFASIIRWNELGTAFSVFDFELLVVHVLPLYFRGRLDAFRQQLREHGFQLVSSDLPVAQLGAVETYRHAHFLRGNPNKLSFIVRTPLPRKRTRRKKLNVTIKVEVKTENVPYSDPVKTEPLPLVAMVTSPAAKVLEDLDEINSAGNSTNPLFTDDERFDILQWLELPAVDAQPSLSSSYGSLDELDLLFADAECENSTLDRGVEQLTEDQLDMFMRLLATPASVGDCTLAHATEGSAVGTPVSYLRSPLWDAGHQFSEDTLHSMMECFSTVPT